MAILYEGHALAEALAAGLRLRGWLPDVVEKSTVYAAGARQPALFVEDDLGGLPAADIRTVVRMVATDRRLVVVVAGSAALTDIVPIVAVGATAVNADQPYRRVLTMVHEALNAGHAPQLAHEVLLADLRLRAEEAARFGTLTARECAVLGDLAAGRSAESIAANRSVALSTIRSQIAAVLRKLGVRSQGAAIALTYRSCADQRITEPLARFHQNYG